MRIGYAKNVTEEAFASANVERVYLDTSKTRGSELVALLELGIKPGAGDVVVLLRSGDIRGVQRQLVEDIATVEIHKPDRPPVKPGRKPKVTPTPAMRLIWQNLAYSTNGAVARISEEAGVPVSRHNCHDWFGPRGLRKTK